MTRRYNGQHPSRGRSNYPKRLAARNLGKTPVMPKLSTLRKKAGLPPPPVGVR
jgi:hypothetical protein